MKYSLGFECFIFYFVEFLYFWELTYFLWVSQAVYSDICYEHLKIGVNLHLFLPESLTFTFWTRWQVQNRSVHVEKRGPCVLLMHEGRMCALHVCSCVERHTKAVHTKPHKTETTVSEINKQCSRRQHKMHTHTHTHTYIYPSSH